MQVSFIALPSLTPLGEEPVCDVSNSGVGGLRIVKLYRGNEASEIIGANCIPSPSPDRRQLATVAPVTNPPQHPRC